MTANPLDPNATASMDQQTAPPPVMTSDQIMQHVDSVYHGLPDPVKAALDHAHTLTGGAPSTSLSGVAKPSTPPAIPSPAMGASPPASDVAPAPVDAQAGSQIVPAASAMPSPDTSDSANSESGLGASQLPRHLSPAQSELNRVQSTGPGYTQIQNPFLRGLATVGNGLANVIGQTRLGHAITENIPGTASHNALLKKGLEKQVGDEEAEQKASDESSHSGAQTALENAQAGAVPAHTALESAEAQNYLTEAQARQNPALKPFSEPVIDPKDPDKTPRIGYYDEHHPGAVTYGPAVGAKPVEQHAPTNDLEAWIQAPENKGKPIEGVLNGYWSKKSEATGQAKEKPLTPETAKTLNAASNSIGSKYGLPEDPFHNGMSDSEVKHVQGLLNSVIQRNQGAQNITINQSKADAAKANIPAAVENVSPKFVQHAVTGYEKISNEYQNAQSANDDIQTALDEAKKGNKLAYAYEPTLGVLTINTAAGVKRVNMPEIQSYAGAGSLGDKIIGYFQKQTTGASIPDNILKDMGEFHQSLANNAAKKYNSKIDIINKTYGSNYPHETSGSATGPVKIANEDDYNKLAKGTTYIDPDGKQRTKL